jgi:hypothetical protein
MQTHPGIVLLCQLAQRTGQIGHVRTHWLAIPKAGAKLDINAIRTRVL